MLHTALAYDDGPVAMRYPRGAGVGVELPGEPAAIGIGTGETLVQGERVALVGYGAGVQVALEAAELLRRSGFEPTVCDARFAKPLDGELLMSLAAGHELLVTVEENVLAGGFGSAVRRAPLRRRRARAALRCCASASPTATSRTASRSCSTRRSGSPPSGSPSASRGDAGARERCAPEDAPRRRDQPTRASRGARRTADTLTWSRSSRPARARRSGAASRSRLPARAARRPSYSQNSATSANGANQTM